MVHQLAIDIGNTHICFGIFKEGSLLNSWRVDAQVRRTSDEYKLLISGFFNLANVEMDRLDSSVICSVSPSATDNLLQAISPFCVNKPMVVTPQHKTNLKSIDYSLNEIGTDRIADAVAAYELYGGVPLIIVDAGTGLVFDAVSKDGAYLGGAIAPGLEIAAEALNSKTALLPQTDFKIPASAIGKNTNHSLRSGFLLGFGELINGLIDRFADELTSSKNERVCTIATGGMAQLIATLSGRFDYVDSDLTLKGLQLIYDLNNQTT